MTTWREEIKRQIQWMDNCIDDGSLDAVWGTLKTMNAKMPDDGLRLIREAHTRRDLEIRAGKLDNN